MKSCPKCSSQYSDLTLRFCLQDGTPLVGEVKQSTVDTVSLSNPVTSEKILPTQNFIDIRPDQARAEGNYRAAHFAIPRPQKSRKGLIIGLAALPVLLVLGAGAVGGWLYLSGQKQALASGKPVSIEPAFTDPANAVQRPMDPTAQDNTRTRTLNSTSTASINVEGIRKDIAGIVDSWKVTAETCNIADYSRRYGEKVEYFDRHGVTASEISGEERKTCDAYSKIEIHVDNMVVAVDAEGDAATAIFDKEWRYEASPKLAQGKAHVKLHFRKVGDEWKIVSEKYLKTYYIKN